MRKTYMMLFALVLSVLGATTAAGQKIYTAELDASMFKAWDGCGANANVVENPAPIDVTDENPNGTPFSCDNNLYKEIGDWSGIFGNTAAYYLWYANLTGTKEFRFIGTPGFKFWVQFNRQAPVEGGDAHGGEMVQQELTIGEDGTVTYDCSSLEFVHLNCIKTKGSGIKGVIKSIEIVGTVRPVTGILSMISNGDAEGDDLSSFPVSYDGPNNGDTANDKPEIVAGEGVDGSKCFKVTSFPNPTETWHTQFYVKSDEVLPQGTKWKLVMSVKADNECTITTSAQAQPRAWKGSMGIDEFKVNSEWQEFSWSGEIGVDDFQSIAFDLNNDNGSAGNGGCGFYFDNIQFGVDLGGANPLSEVKATYGGDVIRVNLGDNTNMKDLVRNAGGTRVIYPNECASVAWNGKNVNLTSVEGLTDGNLYIFLDDMDGEGGTDFNDDEAKVVVGFKNSTDANLQLTFKEGKWAGEAVPEFGGFIATFEEGLGDGEYYSYLWGAPEFMEADPEVGSFNLPADTKEFKVTFNQKVKSSTVVATLDNEKLTVSPADELVATVTLTRTGSDELKGAHTLKITSVTGERDLPLENPVSITYGFGPVEVDPNDQPKDIVPASYFEEVGGGGIPVGYNVVVGDEIRVNPNTFGSNASLKTYSEGGDFTRALYFRQDYVTFGEQDEYPLALEGGKTYTFHFNTARWKSSGQYTKFELIGDNQEVLFSKVVENNPDVNGAQNIVVTGSTVFDEKIAIENSGNYMMKWTCCDAEGNQGSWNEMLLANVSVKYVPNVPGIAELTALNNALDAAKAALSANSDDRYSGASYDALKAIIEKVEAEKAGYTAPSVYAATTAAIELATKSMNDHRMLCDDYDPLPQNALEIVDKYADTKFAVTDIYKNLIALVDKYGEKKQETVTDPETGEETQQTVLVVKVIKDDAELTAASNELKNAIALAVGHGDVARSAKGMFTEGEPKMGDWEATCSGVAVLVDRIRHGVVALTSLGVAADDALVVEANNALTDDDALVENLKKRVKKELYEQLKNADNTLFKAEEGDEESTVTYDMTVFVKNPSIYCLNATANYSEENIPGWVVTDCRGFSTGWSNIGTAQIPVGVMFSNWSGSFNVNQTIEDLPAGVYTLTAGFGERDSEENLEGSYFYAKTSANVEDSLIAPCTVVGQAFPVDNLTIEDVVVTDGKLTLGVEASQSSKVFFNEVKIFMTGAATGFDYGKAYEEVLAGIDETVAHPEKVRAIQLFDLNGRQIAKARKGIVIVKKVMTDGSIRTEKVVVK